MIVLGLNCYHANSAAALIIDGVLTFAVEEERLNRVKNSGGFPFLSIVECLKYNNLKLSDIDIVAINSDPKKQIFRKCTFALKNLISLGDIKKKIKSFSRKISLEEEFTKIKNYGNFKGKIVFVEHHLTHIASSYYLSNFEEACGVSVDGSGDFTTTSNALCKKNSINIQNRIFYPHSLGIFYTAISNFLGFDYYGEEYKVMAMGAYGKNTLNSKLEKLLILENTGTFKLNLKYFIHHKNINTFTVSENKIIISKLLEEKKVEDLLGIKKRGRGEDFKPEHFNLARSLQYLFEKAYLNYINFSYDKYGIDNLCLAGGCAMNSLANGKILENTKFKKLYIQPAAYDAGGAIGAALQYVANNDNNIIKKNRVTKLYLGPLFKNSDIKKIINNNKYDISNKNITVNTYSESSRELVLMITDLLEKKKIVGIFRGRLEWGARSLGNRSILADPRGKEIKNIINQKIKRRESFRPFAPIILYDDLKEWFFIEREIPSMMEVYKIKENKKDIIPAVVHKDGTCRLQTLRKDDNHFIYNLLYEFKKKTKIPIILNTSFNENEPIVCKPEEALNTFFRTDMDALVLEDYLLLKK